MEQRKTLIVQASMEAVGSALAQHLGAKPLLAQVGRLTMVQDRLIDTMSDESIRSIAAAFSVPLVAIRYLDEIATTQEHGRPLALVAGGEG